MKNLTLCVYLWVSLYAIVCVLKHTTTRIKTSFPYSPPFFFGLFCPLFSHVAGRIPELGIKLAPTVVEEAWSPNHWTTREFPNMAPF